MRTLLSRAWRAFDDRSGASKLLGPLLNHLVPPGSTWLYVFGSATLFAFIVQVVTGIALSSGYIESTGDAYPSLQFITHDARFGHLLRGIHYFGASAMVLFLGVHTIRVFLTAAYKFPRELNWISGAVLFILTIAMGFTGQLLRWDQNAVWSVIVGAEQAGRVPYVGGALAYFLLGGDTVGGATLSRFFAFHVFFIPAIIFLFLAFHLWLVLEHGISEPPVAGRPVDPAHYRAWYQAMLRREGKPFWPDAAWRDVVFGTAMIGGIVLLGWLVGPPELGKPPDPTIIEAYPRPDWYLLWYYAMLALIPPKIETFVIVLAPFVAGLVMLTLPLLSNRGERSPLRRPWAIGVVLLIVVMVGSLWHAGIYARWSPDFEARPLSPAVVGTTTGPIAKGAQLFHSKGCEACHSIAGSGGHRGPDLTDVGDRLTREQLTVRILNGGGNMPAFAATTKPAEVDALVAFLRSRTVKAGGRPPEATAAPSATATQR